MRNSRNVWSEPENAQYPLPELRDAYMLYLSSRSRPVAAGTRERYEFDLKSFEASLVLHHEPLVLDSLSPFNVERWLLDMREGRIGHGSGKNKVLTPVTISTRLQSLKTFIHKYIYRHLELTNRDLLAKVERFEAPERSKEGLTTTQLEQVLGCYADSDEYTHVRDRAMLAVYAASGLRFAEVLTLELEQLDPYGGWIRTIGKGNRERIVRIGDRALNVVRAYRRVRRAQDGVTALFTTDAGGSLTYSGGQSIFRRLKKACGLPWMHSHRFRHTWAQTALKKGAER
jgi:integrase/recombinase XerD